MTMTSPEHALACAHISDLLRAAAQRQRAPKRTHAGVLAWLRRGQLGTGSAGPC